MCKDTIKIGVRLKNEVIEVIEKRRQENSRSFSGECVQLLKKQLAKEQGNA